MDRLKEKVKHLFKLINEPHMKVLPGDLAFFMFLSIIPIITLIGSLATLFKVPINSMINTVQGSLPVAVSEL